MKIPLDNSEIPNQIRFHVKQLQSQQRRFRTVPMTHLQRKAAFQHAATLAGKTLEAAANEACGVTWFHLSEGLKGKAHRPLSDEVKRRFADFVGHSVTQLFGAPEPKGRRRKRIGKAA